MRNGPIAPHPQNIGWIETAHPVKFFRLLQFFFAVRFKRSPLPWSSTVVWIEYRRSKLKCEIFFQNPGRQDEVTSIILLHQRTAPPPFHWAQAIPEKTRGKNHSTGKHCYGKKCNVVYGAIMCCATYDPQFVAQPKSSYASQAFARAALRTGHWLVTDWNANAASAYFKELQHRLPFYSYDI